MCDRSSTVSDVAPNNNRLTRQQNFRIRPDTVVAMLGGVVQQAKRTFHGLVLNVNEHFEDLRIWSVLEQGHHLLVVLYAGPGV